MAKDAPPAPAATPGKTSVDNILQIATVLLPLCYMLVAAAYGFVFFTDNPRAAKLSSPSLKVLLALHLAYLLLLAWRWSQFPAATVSQVLSAVAFAIALVYVLVEHLGQERSTGFLMLSLACFFEVLSALLRTRNPPDLEIFHSPMFAIHVSCGLLGYAAFAVAAGYGFLFLRLYSEIKRGRFHVFFGKLPPLEVLERMTSVALAVGFFALTGSVITGATWAQKLFGGTWFTDPKFLVTLATWAFYGLALALRRWRRWQGRQTAMASIAGFAAILFSVLAVNLFLSNIHEFR